MTFGSLDSTAPLTANYISKLTSLIMLAANCLEECAVGGTCVLNSTTMDYACKCSAGYSGSKCERGMSLDLIVAF